VGGTLAQQLAVSDVQGYTSKPVLLTCRVESFDAGQLTLGKVSGNFSAHRLVGGASECH